MIAFQPFFCLCAGILTICCAILISVYYQNIKFVELQCVVNWKQESDDAKVNDYIMAFAIGWYWASMKIFLFTAFPESAQY